jgi:mannose-6-phosphate isomerase-like protein (cupin superfamily)
MDTTRWTRAAIGVALLLAVAGSVVAADASKTGVIARADLQWKDAGMPGVSSACVEGDMAKGPSHFFLRYAKGFVAPLHHHSPDHYVTVVSGTLALTVDGKEHVLPAGSFFALTNKAPHSARVVGDEDAVMFVDARGPWDVVPEKAPAAH